MKRCDVVTVHLWRRAFWHWVKYKRIAEAKFSVIQDLDKMERWLFVSTYSTILYHTVVTSHNKGWCPFLTPTGEKSKLTVTNKYSRSISMTGFGNDDRIFAYSYKRIVCWRLQYGRSRYSVLYLRSMLLSSLLLLLVCDDVKESLLLESCLPLSATVLSHRIWETNACDKLMADGMFHHHSPPQQY